MGKLYDKLINYNKQGIYPFHMPGHKRNIGKINFPNPFEIDITEIEGFDNLHCPNDTLKELMDNAALIYLSKKTYFLINGSTCGILSAIAASTKRGAKILISRNSHKSVYNAVYLGGLNPLYIYPEVIKEFDINGGINPDGIERILKVNSDIMAVLITSPTYEGIVSDIKSIADIVHKYNIPLIVDEAHGAHFGMHKNLPQSSISLGADIVIQSLHKTMPSLTQTALLHVNSDRISISNLERFLSIYQSSSPSYVLLASIDSCISFIYSEGERLFSEYMKLIFKYRKLISGLKNIRTLELNNDIKNKYYIYEYDITKIVISVKGYNYSGTQLYNDLLNKYNIQVEMASSDYVILITSCFDSEEGFVKLYEALLEIDNEMYKLKRKDKPLNNYIFCTKMIYNISTALEKDTIKTKLDNAVQKVSAEYMYLYPPGIPIVVPGEIITDNIITICRSYELSGLKIQGLESGTLDEIKIIKENN